MWDVRVCNSGSQQKIEALILAATLSGNWTYQMECQSIDSGPEKLYSTLETIAIYMYYIAQSSLLIGSNTKASY